jgi:hypothetical protein
MDLIVNGPPIENYIHKYAEPYDTIPEMSEAGEEKWNHGKDILIGGLGGMALGFGLHEVGKLSKRQRLAQLGELAMVGSTGVLLKSAAKLFTGDMTRFSTKKLKFYVGSGRVIPKPNSKLRGNILNNF